MDAATATSSALGRARAGLLAANLVLVGVLAASGLALLAWYRPGWRLAAFHGLAGRSLLRWSGLWIWAVAVEAGRTSFRGFLWLAGDDIRLVTIGHADLRPSTMLLRLGLHLAAALAAAAAAAALVATVRRPGDRVGVDP